MRRAQRLLLVLSVSCASMMMGVHGSFPSVSAQAPMMPQERAARLVARGDRLRASGDSVSASAFYRDAINAAPRELTGYLALGRAYAEAGALSDAIEVFNVALHNVGERTELALGLARAYEQNREPERALMVLRDLAHSHPEERVLHEERARMAESLGQFAEALDARRRVLTLLSASEGEEERVQAQARVRALELLVASSDRVRSSTLCAGATSPVRRALAHCD